MKIDRRAFLGLRRRGHGRRRRLHLARPRRRRRAAAQPGNFPLRLTDAQWRQRLNPAQYATCCARRRPSGRDRARSTTSIAAASSTAPAAASRSSSVGRQVRQRHRLAELLPAAAAARSSPAPTTACSTRPHRSALRPLRRPSRPRLRRRPAPDRPALLHERRRDDLPADSRPRSGTSAGGPATGTKACAPVPTARTISG